MQCRPLIIVLYSCALMALASVHSPRQPDLTAALLNADHAKLKPPPGAACLPFLDSFSEFVLKLLSGGSSRTVDTVVGGLHVIDIPGKGTLPPAVLLHGITSRGCDQGLLAMNLIKHCKRVILVDLPGHGKTPLPPPSSDPDQDAANLPRAVSQMIDALLGNERCVIWGNSLGGLIAVKVALQSPQKGELVRCSETLNFASSLQATCVT
jgi:pimeloyl-ACP methyl ester carboxylesterase